ncbi:MAG TPA: chemotaxis protein CheA [Gemmatimonadaceae bacterium]
MSVALRTLGATDLVTRAALRDDVMRLIARVPAREARACVSLRLVAEAFRSDRDRGPRQPALHQSAHALLDAVRKYLTSPALRDRLALLESPERSTLAIMRGVPENSPTLQPRTSDLIGDADRKSRSDAERTGELTLFTLPEESDRALLGDFLDEAREYLESAEAAMLALERDPSDVEAAQVVLRAFHSIKGTAGFLKLDGVVALAHHGETLLADMRRRDIAFTGHTADLALQALDTLSDLVRRLDAARQGAPLVYPPGFQELLAALRHADGSPSPRRGAAAGGAPEGAGSPVRDAGGASSARVRLDRLDAMVDLVGELVVAHWMIAQDPDAGRAHPELARKVAHAGKLVRELHDMSMAMRMVPLRATCHKLLRLARDLAQQAGKQVRCEVEGEMTELDRNMVELVADPLMHMVRNAIDHGLELPEERAGLGKPMVGRLALCATQVNGQVIIELSDDGRGLQRERILDQARARGLVHADEQLADADILDLIFAPGLSTAEHVTEVSGRGVGMDVVRRNVEALHGRVDIRSTLGEGTTFTMRVPLTLAITDGMLVRVGEERYIVPTTNIVVSVRPERSALFTVGARGEMARLRQEVLPVVRLHRLLGVAGAREDPTAALLMVVSAGERRCALLVDAIVGQQQVVAKPATAGIGDVPGIAGAAILGDGCVGLILDIPRLMDMARRVPVADVQAVA